MGLVISLTAPASELFDGGGRPQPATPSNASAAIGATVRLHVADGIIEHKRAESGGDFSGAMLLGKMTAKVYAFTLGDGK